MMPVDGELAGSKTKGSKTVEEKTDGNERTVENNRVRLEGN
jgi:hypothetical protein